MLELVGWGIFAVFSGVVVQAVADKKGLANGPWFAYGFFIPVISFIHVLLREPANPLAEAAAIANGSMKRCPACAELIRAAATKCRYCQHTFEPAGETPAHDIGELDRECPACHNTTRRTAKRCAYCKTPFTAASA